MRALVTVVLVVFGISVMISGGIEIYGTDGETEGWGARLSYILGATLGAGLVVAGLGFGKSQPWAPLLAIFNLAGMAVLSAVSAFRLFGHLHATHHVTRALLAVVLIVTIGRIQRSR